MVVVPYGGSHLQEFPTIRLFHGKVWWLDIKSSHLWEMVA